MWGDVRAGAMIPEGGRYDVWIGSFEDGEQIDGELNVTELESNHP